MQDMKNTQQRQKISHLFYMDDLKLIGKTDKELQKQMHTVKRPQ
jgi:hypothetical protein